MQSLYAQMPNDLEQRPYKLYRSGPKGLKARLRGEEDLGLGPDRPGSDRDDRPRRRRWFRGRLTWQRVLLYLAMAVVGWLLLSLALFIISAQIERGKVPNSAKAALTSGPNMLTSTDTVLILGTDQRPKGSKEPGANTNDAGSRSDTIMLWRIGGGTSRRLSIPRDTVVPIPGHGDDKINAAYAYGGPALAIKTVEEFARNEGVNLKINHLIIVNLAAFPEFINAIGGVDVKTGRVCSEISGGVKKGGFTLNLRPGTHHLNGVQALLRAHAREPVQSGRQRPHPGPAPAADPQRRQVAAVLPGHVLPAAVGVMGRAQGAAHGHGRPDAAVAVRGLRAWRLGAGQGTEGHVLGNGHGIEPGARSVTQLRQLLNG